MTRKSDKKTEYITTRLPRDLAERLREIGKAEDRTLSGVLRRIVTQALEEHPVYPGGPSQLSAQRES